MIQGQQKPWEYPLCMSYAPLHTSVSFFLPSFLCHSVTLEEEDDSLTVTKLHVIDQTTVTFSFSPKRKDSDSSILVQITVMMRKGSHYKYHCWRQR